MNGDTLSTTARERREVVSEPGGQYTLIVYYSPSSPLTSEEISRREHFDDIDSALSRALKVLQEGGNPTHLIVDDAVIFSGNDLKEAMTYVSANVGLQGLSATENIRKLLSEMLIKQLVKTVKIAHEHFGAVAVYASMLEELYKAADQAIQSKNLELLFKITGRMAFWDTPSENDVRRWGKDFLQAYRRDASWLRDAKTALTKIEAAAMELGADSARNEELKNEIIKFAEDGLVTHL